MLINIIIKNLLIFLCGLICFVAGDYPNHHLSENLVRMLCSALIFGGVITILIGLDLKGLKPPAMMVCLGDASFSIYLIHSTVLCHLRSNLQGTTLQIISIISIPIIFVVSHYLFRLFERPAAPIVRKLFFGDKYVSRR